MNELVCRDCGTMTNCSETAVAVTCSSCVNSRISGVFTTTPEEITVIMSDLCY